MIVCLSNQKIFVFVAVVIVLQIKMSLQFVFLSVWCVLGFHHQPPLIRGKQRLKSS